MSNWINLKINTVPVEEQEEGMEISVSPSPYDVPGAIKADIDENKGRLRIQFRYIGSEPLRHEQSNEGISFGTGVNSGRLYEIDVNIDRTAKSMGEVVDRIFQNIGQIAQNHSNRIDNYRMATEALRSSTPTILRQSESAIGPKIFA
jgi:hypothetical protein